MLISDQNLTLQLIKAREKSLIEKNKDSSPTNTTFNKRQEEIKKLHSDQILNPYQRSRLNRANAKLLSHVPVEYEHDDLLGDTIKFKKVWDAIAAENTEDKYRAVLFTALKDSMESAVIFLDAVIHLEDSSTKKRILDSLTNDHFNTGKNKISVDYNKEFDLLDTSITDSDGVTLTLQTQDDQHAWLLEDQMQRSLSLALMNHDNVRDHQRGELFSFTLCREDQDHANVFDIATEGAVATKSLAKALNVDPELLAGGKIFEFFSKRSLV